MTAKLENTEYYLAVEDGEGALQFARDRFVARFGQEPAIITPGLGGIILAGPVPTNDRRPPTTDQLPLEV